MVNVVTNTRTIVSRINNTVTQYITVLGVDAQESDLIVYDSSAVAAALGVADPLDCIITKVFYSTNSVLTIARLEFDATADVHALSLPQGGAVLDKDFTAIGGLTNNAGTGITGDIKLTTTGLEAASALTLILEVAAR